MSLPILQGRQTPSAQFHQQLMQVIEDAVCVTWCEIEWGVPDYKYSISFPKGRTTH